MSNSMPFVFNPREERPEVLEEMLVGRDDILNELESDLLAQSVSATRQHWLIRGPRGIGKTHLIAVLYHRIHRKQELSSLLPVWLGEAEAFNAYSAGMLLYAIANRLAEEFDRDDREAAASLRAGIARIGFTGDDPALFNSLGQLLKQVAQDHNKILVVLMENLDVWLQNVSGKRGEREAGRMRALLSDDKEFLFISTTPTRYMPKLSRPSSPLYGHLRERKLQPMSEDQLRDLFVRLARLTGRKLEIDADSGSYEARLRWRVLYHLASGNPRAAVMAFSVLSGGAGVQAMVAELSRLLDAQTAYYEARLGRLAPRERTIVTALALSPTTLTISEIARESRLPERSLSTQIKRLLDEGHISPAGDQRGKGSVFELTDGLFRTWHHYRYGRRKLEPLVRFLALWHTESELELALSATSSEMANLSSSFERHLFASTQAQLKWALDYYRSPYGTAERQQLWQECGREIREPYSPLVSRGQEKKVESAITAKDEAPEEDSWNSDLSASGLLARLGKNPDSRLEQHVANAIVNLGVTLGEAGKADEEIASYRVLISRFAESPHPEVQELVAKAMLFLGISLGQASKTEEEIAAYRGLITRFGASKRPELQDLAARAMMNLGITLGEADNAEDAIASYRDLITRFGENNRPELQVLVAAAMQRLGIALGEVGRAEEAIATYRDLITRFGESNGSALHEEIAAAMVNLGVALGKAGNAEEAIAAFRDFIIRFGENRRPRMQEQVAIAMVNLGIVLGQVGNAEEAISTYRDLLIRFAKSTRPELQEQVARATVNLGAELGKVGQAEDAIATYRDFITGLSESLRPELQEQVARATVNLGFALGLVGKAEEEIATYRALIMRFDKSTRPVLQEGVARAAVNLGITLGQLGKTEEAIATYRALITRFGETTHPELQEQVAVAMLNLGTTLGKVGNAEEEVATYRVLITRFGESPRPELHALVARAMLKLGIKLGQRGKAEEEIATYRDLMIRFGRSTRPAVQEAVAFAMRNLGVALRQAGEAEEAISTYRALIARFGESPRLELQEPVARVMLSLGIALGQARKAEEEIFTYRALITRFGESPSPELQEPVSTAMLSLGIALRQAGKAEEAIATIRDLITKFGENDAESIRATLAGGLLLQGGYLLASKQAAEAVEAATRAEGVVTSLSPALGSDLVIPIQILLSDSLRAVGRKSNSQLALKSAASRLATMSKATLSQVEALLKKVLTRLPLPEVRRLLDELLKHADPEVNDMARLHGFVLDVLEAQEARRGRAKLSPAIRKGRALARVPAELRAVVAEKAEILRKERRKG